ncbi:MAG TPA: hypothetical protein VL860_01720 [Planctomycetota bacterium]|nr:hypothetical protein [Planctomycetota bacterium]
MSLGPLQSGLRPPPCGAGLMVAMLIGGLVAALIPAASAAQVVVIQNGGGPPRVIIDGVEQGAEGEGAAAPDPIAMAVNEVERGKSSILKVLPKLDKAIVPALERSYLSSLHVDEDDALLLVASLNDDNYFIREQASQALIHVKADIQPALTRVHDKTTDPEVAWRLAEIQQMRSIRGGNPDDVLDEALKLVYDRWFDELLEERAVRLLNDPLDEAAALFFVRADAEKIVAGIAKRPPLEQARLLLAQARLHSGDKPALRALGRLDRAVVAEAARLSGWPQELPLPEESLERIFYEHIEGNTIVNLLVLPKDGKAMYPVSQAFCVFQIPVGPGNARVQVGAILRGRYELNLVTGGIQPFTVRATWPVLPAGMLLPRIPPVDGLVEDWNTDVNRVPLWAKPFTPPEAVKPNWKFVLNAKHDLAEADPADQQLTAAACLGRLRKSASDWLNAPPPAAPGETGDRRRPADAQALQNAAPGQLPAVVATLGKTAQPAWAEAFVEIAQSNRDGAGAAGLEALFRTDPARAGNLALRLSRVVWNPDRARYAVGFLIRHFAATPVERVWDFEQRMTPPGDLAARAAKGTAVAP